MTEQHRIHRQKLVVSGILSAFIVVMVFTRPWEHRTEILGNLVLPDFNQSMILKKPDEIKQYLQKKNAARVKVLVNRKTVDEVTLATLGINVAAPDLEHKESLLSFLGNLIGQEEHSPVRAEVRLDQDEFEKYLNSVRPKVEIEPVASIIMWNEERRWHIEPMKRGLKIDDKTIATGMTKLFTSLEKGRETLTLDLRSKKVAVYRPADEKKIHFEQWSQIQSLIEKPITLKIDKEVAATVDLNSQKDFIRFTDISAELNDDVLKLWVEDFAEQYGKEAGEVRIVGKKETKPGVFKAVTEGDFTHGQEIKIDNLVNDIKASLSTPDRIAQVHVDDVPFRVFSELEQTAYDLLSVGWSEYSTGNKPDRVHNFTTGLKRVSETLVDRGQEISFNKPLGKFDSEFVKGLAILGTTAQPVIGGGICQASTTFYRALINLGVPIVQWKNHSWDLSYYRKGGYGLDATIYPEQGLDVKGLNDLDSQLYIHAYTVPHSQEAFVLIYGKGDGRKVTLRPEKDNLKYVPGAKQIRWTQIVEFPNGDIRENQIVSTYKK